MTRREFLNRLIVGGVAALAASVLYPLLRYITPPAGVEPTVSSVVAAKKGELASNSAKIFRFGQKPAILLRTPKGEYRALSAVCTHLNCTVQYDPASSVIVCACHNGHFDLNGAVVSGPPPRPLERYVVNERGDDILVSKA